MKNIVSLFSFAVLWIGLNTCLSAQGTLQFNRVLLVSSSAETVPAGKVWKVTGYTATTMYGSGSGTGTPSSFTYFVNGSTRFFGHAGRLFTTYNSSTPASTVMEPLWLPAGTSLQAGSGVGEISVIEFNVIP